MKRSTLTLLMGASAFYLVLLTILRSIAPEATLPTVSLLALPLIMVALVLIADLQRRSTLPVEHKIPETAQRVRAVDVQSLTRQLEVAANSSPAYFESILRKRLREILVEKVSLETGIEKENVRRTLADRRLGPVLLKDAETYALLYHPPMAKTGNRLQMMREIIDRIEGWKA